VVERVVVVVGASAHLHGGQQIMGVKAVVGGSLLVLTTRYYYYYYYYYYLP